jgi:hypothetical protein
MSSEHRGFLKWLYAFIPLHIGNGIILFAMQCFRFFQRHGFVYAASHFDLNIKGLNLLKEDEPAIFDRFIECQNRFGCLYLGMSTMDKAGCEVIAVYNALTALDVADRSLPKLIEGFEKDGIMHSGRYGVSVPAMKDALIKAGLKVDMTSKKDKMKALFEKSKVMILTMYNDKKDLGQQVHSVMIESAEGRTDAETKKEYFVHNMYGDGRVMGPYYDWDDMLARLRDGKTGPISLMGINKM